jgi:hypothetical protein
MTVKFRSSLSKCFVAPALLIAVVAASFAAFHSQQAEAAVTDIVVTTLDDSGAGSLREAITTANNNDDGGTITFGNSLTGTITLASDFPNITKKVTIVGPGQSDLHIDGANLYRPFNVLWPSGELVISDVTLKKGLAVSNVGGLINNDNAKVTATNVTFSTMSSGVAVFSLGNRNYLTLATYTNCTFIDLNIGIGGDHGNTPDTVSAESVYANRTYVVSSTFSNNTWGIRQERFTKVEDSTFNNNVNAAEIRGLNRTQVLSSSFTDNSVGLSFTNWTPVQWTSIGTNNRYVYDNTFRRNSISLDLNDSWNSNQRSQQWSTISDNEWDGLNTWIRATYYSGSNQTVTVTSLNSAGREWVESGNFLTVQAPSISLSSSSRTVTQNQSMPSLYTITNTGGTIASYAISPTPTAGLSFSTSTGLLTGTPTVAAAAKIYTITATNAGGSSSDTFTLTIEEETPVTTTTEPVVTTTTTPAVTTTTLPDTATTTPVATTVTMQPAVGQSAIATIAPGVTTTTVPAPVAPTASSESAPLAPSADLDAAVVVVDGVESAASITRSNNTLNIVGGGVTATISGMSPSGEPISLDDDGNLRLSDGDQIVVEATGFISGEKIGVWLFSAPNQLGSLTADATGKISGRFALPTDVESGDHRLVLEGVNSDGSPVILGLGIAVGEIESSSVLARLLIAIPVALAIIIGLVIPTTLRRRRRESALV